MGELVRRKPGLPWYNLDPVHDAMSKLRKLDVNSLGLSNVFIVDMDEKLIAEIWFDDHTCQWYVN